MAVIKKYLQFIKSIIRQIDNPRYTERLENDLRKQGNTQRLSHEYLKTLDDPYYYWLMVHGPHTGLVDATVIPGLAPASIQRLWTGNTGDAVMREAFAFYLLIRDAAARYSKPIDSQTKVWDFGVGWGRIIRFFMREINEENLVGTDCYPEALDICRATMPRFKIEENGIFPPTKFEAGCFDIVYLFSVFSHLSEEAHLKWVKEFARCLKPGGLLVATTRSRNHILFLGEQRRKRLGAQGMYQSTVAVEAFPDVEKTLKAYDNGEFCYAPTGGGGPLDASFYGEACIPEAYARKHWNEWFDVREMRVADKRCIQNIFFCVRR